MYVALSYWNVWYINKFKKVVSSITVAAVTKYKYEIFIPRISQGYTGVHMYTQ